MGCRDGGFSLNRIGLGVAAYDIRQIGGVDIILCAGGPAKNLCIRNVIRVKQEQTGRVPMSDALSAEASAEISAAVTRVIEADPPPHVLAAEWLETPLGPMLAVAGVGGLHVLEFVDRDILSRELSRVRREIGGIAFTPHPVLTMLAMQLAAYFTGQRAAFDVPLRPLGSTFHQSVWAELRHIPAGTTESYKALSIRMGKLSAIRAVAQANGANPIAILVPCHRVIGADGKLVGYGGKLWRKRWLLNHERHFTPAPDLETENNGFLPGLR